MTKFLLSFAFYAAFIILGLAYFDVIEHFFGKTLYDKYLDAVGATAMVLVMVCLAPESGKKKE